MNYKSANTHSARNAGLVAVGMMVSLIGWPVAGYWMILSSFLGGCGSYLNDKLQDNDPSKFDPVFTTAGGLLVAGFMYARQFL